MSAPPASWTHPRYRLLDVVGQGAQAEVLRVIDETLQIEVAVKRFYLREGTHAQESFQREVRLIASICSPHVIRIRDLGTDVQGRPWLVTDLVKGQSLAQCISTGPLTEDLVTKVARDLASAVRACHDVGCIHHDIKPANVLLTHDSGELVLIDFGIANGTAGVDSDAGIAGTSADEGTPPFMAPECFVGASSTASDVYSFALTIAAAVLGRHPLGEATSATRPEDWEALLRLRPWPAEELAARLQNAPELLKILIQASATNPSDRPNATQLLSACEVARARYVARTSVGVADKVRSSAVGLLRLTLGGGSVFFALVALSLGREQAGAAILVGSIAVLSAAAFLVLGRRITTLPNTV